MSESASRTFYLDTASTPELNLDELAIRLGQLAGTIDDLVSGRAAVLSSSVTSGEHRSASGFDYGSNQFDSYNHDAFSESSAIPWTSYGQTSNPWRNAGYMSSIPKTGIDPAEPVYGEMSSSLVSAAANTGFNQKNTIAVNLEQLTHEASRQSELLDYLRQDLKALYQLLESAVSSGVSL